MIRLIASDMDGTLVNSAHYISEKNVSAIKKAQELGVTFIISTGRSFDDAYPQVKKAGLSCDYLVMNGSELRNNEGDVIQTLYMNQALVKKVVDKLQEENLYIELYTSNGIFSVSNIELCKQATATKINHFFPSISLDQAYETAEEHEQYTKISKVNCLEDIWSKEAQVGKIISFSNDQKKLAKLRETIPNELGAHATGSFTINLEITDPMATKGFAIEKYAKSKGIKKSEIMTLGDSFNDISMFEEHFGYTVAMGNAIDAIKEKAKYVTKSNDQDGVGVAIEKYIIKRSKKYESR